MKTLYVMVGLPGSGKSTYASRMRWNEANYVGYISRDTIRAQLLEDGDPYFSREEEVFDMFCDSIVTWMDKTDIIADATHLSHGSRAKLINALAYRGLTTDKYQIVFLVMNTPIETCIKRDANRTGTAHVTEPVIRRMGHALKIPTIDEFPNVKEVRIIDE